MAARRSSVSTTAPAELRSLSWRLAGGLELRIHTQDEVAAEERLLPAPFVGQVERLPERVEHPLLYITREGRIA